jgi:hypothetical protein
MFISEDLSNEQRQSQKELAKEMKKARNEGYNY